MPAKIVIIGAGIAGLSAGCYARMNGFEVEIYESHNLPGGLCTSWKRGDFTFDGCIHCLTGSGPADTFHELWVELGALQGRQIVNHEIFQRYKGLEGREFILYTDIDRLEKHMLELSPADSDNIALFCRLVRKFTRFNFPQTKAYELLNIFDSVKMMWKFLPLMKEYDFCNKTTMKEFAERFRDPLLRDALPRIFGGPDYPLVAIVITLALLHKKAGGYPVGGSLEFARAIERRFLGLGGIFHYGKKVEKVIIGEGVAKGIILKGGHEVMADHVISASDLRNTLYTLLDGKHIHPRHKELLETVPLYPTSVQVSFGVNMDLSAPVSSVLNSYEIDEPVTIGEDVHHWLTEHNYSYDPTLAPAGSSVIISYFRVGDFRYWEKLYQDRNAYKEEKKRILAAVASRFDKLYPGFSANIAESDVATPMTYVRYTGNWKGSYMTWILKGRNARKFQVIPKQVPGLSNLWLAGMWVMAPGGLPTGAKTGRDVVEMICRREKLRFRTAKQIE